MPTIALAAEGITDQIILEKIIFEYYDENIELDVNFLQPTRDATDAYRQGDFGGWEQVFEFLQSPERLFEALQTNDFVIVQVDTDCGEHPNFGLALTLNGTAKTELQLVVEATEIMKNLIAAQILNEYGHRIIFAVTVHSLECWILAAMTNKSRLGSCEKHLFRHVNRYGEQYNKDARSYGKYCKLFAKKKFDAIGILQVSFRMFLEGLPNI